jgi:hypothetical protein
MRSVDGAERRHHPRPVAAKMAASMATVASGERAPLRPPLAVPFMASTPPGLPTLRTGGPLRSESATQQGILTPAMYAFLLAAVTALAALPLITTYRRPIAVRWLCLRAVPANLRWPLRRHRVKEVPLVHTLHDDQEGRDRLDAARRVLAALPDPLKL